MSSLPRVLSSPYLLLLVPPAMWAGNAVIGRAVVSADMPALELSFWRWVCALVLVAPMVAGRLRREWPAVRAHWREMAVISLFSVASYNTFLYLALETAPAINATLVGASMPVVIVALSWVLLSERITGRHAAGIALGLAGAMVVIARGDLSRLAAFELQVGDLWMLAAVGTWSLYSVLLRRFKLALDPLVMLAVQVVFGLLWLSPVMAAHWSLNGWGMPVTGTTALVILYLGAGPSLAAYYTWNLGVRAVGANVAAFYTYLVPLFTAMLAVPVLGELPGWYHLWGVLLIFGGIFLATAWRRGASRRAVR